MKICEIRHVMHKHSFRWKWRYVAPGGGIVESVKTYALYYECVIAARARGYEPQLKCQ